MHLRSIANPNDDSENKQPPKPADTPPLIPSVVSLATCNGEAVER